LNADVLKIDREFIQDLGRDEKTTAIVQFLMNLSLRLDVEVIAEGVETDQQASILRNLGCAMAQGYHFAHPVPAHNLIEHVGSNTTNASPPKVDPAPPT
jgi:EAL domain-containing protein (putative c-di-GMP-specific phosphodiesterase class I)